MVSEQSSTHQAEATALTHSTSCFGRLSLFAALLALMGCLFAMVALLDCSFVNLTDGGRPTGFFCGDNTEINGSAWTMAKVMGPISAFGGFIVLLWGVVLDRMSLGGSRSSLRRSGHFQFSHVCGRDASKARGARIPGFADPFRRSLSCACFWCCLFWSRLLYVSLTPNSSRRFHDNQLATWKGNSSSHLPWMHCLRPIHSCSDSL